MMAFNANFSKSCSRFSEEQLIAIFNTRVAVATTSIASCLITIILLCIMICYLKIWRTLIHRLKLYITIAAIVAAAMYLLQVLPMKSLADGATENHGWGRWCKGIAFFLNYSDWVMLLVICWMTVFLLWLTQPLVQGLKNSINPLSERRKMQFEFTIIIMTLVFPLFFLWVPFIDDDYGLADVWCGNIISKGSECSNATHEGWKTGFSYLVGTWYIPSFIIALLCIAGIVVVACSLWQYKKRKGYSKHISSAITKAAPPTVYLII